MLIAVFSLAGAPGVTTLALALAGTWPEPEPVWMVEADTSGGDVATWWRLPVWPGVVDLAAASRSGQDHETVDTMACSQVLPGGLRVCAAPSTADRTAGAVGLLAQNPKVLKSDRVAVADLGRVVPDAASSALLEAADVAVLVASGDVAHLKRVREAAAGLRTRCLRLGLAVVDPSRSSAEISEAVGLPVWAKLPQDARTAAFLQNQGEVRRPHRRPLIREARALGRTLAEQARSTTTDPVDPTVARFLGEVP
ncbi:P-loop NTPase family protein [Nocardiopsis quinghaiensis]|uniref:hypothetical protein n=1 Tax=Nocardiopsis quinghaiensis TaxID=464995 RepID=UPI00123C0CCF|nr:hypothetical protein [Nocardiopsis quinghaiensis]